MTHKYMFYLVVLLTFVGCTKDPTTPPEKPTSPTDIGLNKLLPYHPSSHANPIRIGILLEVPFYTNADAIEGKALSRIQETLYTLLEGDFSLFQEDLVQRKHHYAIVDEVDS
ncbi:MAG: hypothetical protein ACPH28_03705, partial [Flavobacteriaceae bacterium]